MRCTRTAIPLRSIAAGELGRYAVKNLILTKENFIDVDIIDVDIIE